MRVTALENISVLTGMDMVKVSRIEKALSRESGERFLLEVFTESERLYCDSLSPKARIESYAARFAAKEAVSKALGTGILNEGIELFDIEICKNDLKMPYVVFHGKVKDLAEGMGIFSVSVSLTHEKEYAAACCSMLRNVNEEQ